MDEYIYDAIDLLKALISIPSVSRNEDAAASLLYDKCMEWGLSPTRIGNNVICQGTSYDITRPTILLNSHIDTVNPVDGWTYPPFSPTCDDGCIYGLGSNDAGASVVSLLAAYRVLSQQQCAYNLIFVASCEEEISGKGGIEMVLPKLPQIDVAVVGEPTGMNPAIAEKGLMVLDGEIYGKAGHAARNEGVNAIYQTLPVIEKIKNLQFNKVSQHLGPIKVSVTQINAGTAHNIVPDICHIVVDVRTTDAYTNEQTLEIIREAVGDSCKLTPRSTRLSPSYIPNNHPIVARSIMLGGKPFGSPTLSDQALMPFYSMKMGPGDSARSHTANEYIREQEIREAIAIYISLLSGIDSLN
ncbi:MAG: M20 family metallo-hydrolase [Muribaculaceae bacterium]|nr:M20 family metallo-hydrolase [Muribaculaceae bacterium]